MLRWILDKKGGWIALTLIAVTLFVVANVAAGRIVGMRADLTQDKLFTLSDGTRNILHKLQKPIQLTLYYSEELGKAAPVYGNYALRVKDMLRVIKATAGDKVELSIKDPKPFSEIEDKAVALGLQGVPVDEGGTKVYFGLAAKAGKKEIVIPFFDIEREKFLEYDIASLLYNVGTKNKPVVAVYTSRPMFGDIQMQLRGMPSKPWAVIQQLEDHATVKQLYDLNDIWKIKPNVLMLVQPGKLEPKDYYNIDQYLLRGGKAMIFLDPYNETAALRRMSQFPERVTSRMDKLLNHWGITLVKDRVVGDRRFARMVNAGDEKKIIPAPYLAWLSIRHNGLSQTDPITSQISQLNMESAGILEQTKKESSIRFEPLVTSTPDSDQIDVKLLDGAMPQVLKILENFKPSGKRQVIAARISGTMKSMFPDGPPKEEEKKDEGAAKDKNAKKEEGSKKEEKPSASAGKTSKPAAKPEAEAKPGAKASDPKDKPKTLVKADKAARTVAQAESAAKKEAPAASPSAAKPSEKTGEAKPAATEKPEKAAEKKPDEKTKTPEKKAEAKPKEEEPKAPPYVAESTAPMNVILVADADFLENRFWVQTREFFGQQVQVPFANNSDFVVNAVENLAGGEDLIGLRSRGTAQRPFTKIAQLKLAADQKYRAEEQRLRKKLDDAEKKLAELDKKKAQGGTNEATVNKAVETTASKFTEQVLSTRKALRKVQLALRENIESLEFWLKFINIALIPILVGVLAVILGAVRMRRRKHHADSPAG